MIHVYNIYLSEGSFWPMYLSIKKYDFTILFALAYYYFAALSVDQSNKLLKLLSTLN